MTAQQLLEALQQLGPDLLKREVQLRIGSDGNTLHMLRVDTASDVVELS